MEVQDSKNWGQKYRVGMEVQYGIGLVQLYPVRVYGIGTGGPYRGPLYLYLPHPRTWLIERRQRTVPREGVSSARRSVYRKQFSNHDPADLGPVIIENRDAIRFVQVAYAPPGELCQRAEVTLFGFAGSLADYENSELNRAPRPASTSTSGWRHR